MAVLTSGPEKILIKFLVKKADFVYFAEAGRFLVN